MKNTDFIIEKGSNSDRIHFVGKWVNDKYYSRLVFHSATGAFEVSSTIDTPCQSFNTLSEAIQAAKQDITEKSNTYQDLLNSQIDKAVEAMRFKMTLRMAQLRGSLFGQMVTLRKHA